MENTYQLLAEKVLLQAMTDYVRLQHPEARDKAYLLEAFMDAADMFFDPSYKMGPFEGDNGPMNLEEFLMLATDRERVNIEALQDYLKKETLNFWKPQEQDIMQVPEILTIAGEPWYVEHTKRSHYWIDFDERRIHVDKTSANAQVDFLSALLDILWDETGLKISGKARKKFSQTLFETLVLNNCFK